WLAGLFRTKIIARFAAFAMQHKRVQEFAFRTVSQIGIRYRDSALSKSLAPLGHVAPQAGDRFPWLRLRLPPDRLPEDFFHALDDTRFNLIVVGQPAPTETFGLGDLLRVHAIPDDPHNDAELARVSIPKPSFYLLRPDGHIGLCGSRIAAD